MIIDQLNQIWTSFLEFISAFIIPAWGELITMLPVLLLIGVVGPILTILVIAWLALRDPQAARHGGLRRPAPPGGGGRAG